MFSLGRFSRGYLLQEQCPENVSGWGKQMWYAAKTPLSVEDALSDVAVIFIGKEYVDG